MASAASRQFFRIRHIKLQHDPQSTESCVTIATSDKGQETHNNRLNPHRAQRPLVGRTLQTNHVAVSMDQSASCTTFQSIWYNHMWRYQAVNPARGFYRVPQRTRLRDHLEAEMDETAKGVSVANSKVGKKASSSSLVTMRHARFDCSRCPLHYDRSSHRPTWRITFGDCGIRSHQTSTFDRESLSPPCT